MVDAVYVCVHVCPHNTAEMAIIVHPCLSPGNHRCSRSWFKVVSAYM